MNAERCPFFAYSRSKIYCNVLQRKIENFRLKKKEKKQALNRKLADCVIFTQYYINAKRNILFTVKIVYREIKWMRFRSLMGFSLFDCAVLVRFRFLNSRQNADDFADISWFNQTLYTFSNRKQMGRKSIHKKQQLDIDVPMLIYAMAQYFYYWCCDICSSYILRLFSNPFFWLQLFSHARDDSMYEYMGIYNGA